MKDTRPIIKREDLITTCQRCGHEGNDHALRTISQACGRCSCRGFRPVPQP